MAPPGVPEEEEQGDRSLYALLGVAPTASEEEIRRAYRQLATTLHPDKVADPAQHEEATQLFTRIQEAYEVLSDPHTRDVYDVYGQEGLSAGLELGDKLKTREELRAEWDAFRARQKRDALEAAVNYRGVYVFKVDATALVSPYLPSLPRAPELSSIYMTSGVDVPLESRHWGPWLGSEQDVAHLGGLVSVRKNVGGGSFLAGYKRAFADYSALEVHGAVGLRTLVSAQHTVQLSPESSASLVASWQPAAGVGLQFVTQRQLSSTVSGEYSWVVGPPEAAGMSLGLTRRTEKLSLMGRLEVGAVTGLVCRAVRQLGGGGGSGRLGVKLTTAGVEVEATGQRRFSDVATAGCTVSVGLQGIVLKLRYSRAGHLFEFPVLLSSNPLDWPTLAAAYLLPPLAYWAAGALVVGPLRGAAAARRARAERAAQAEAIRGALALAASAAELMGPVARRRLDRERRAGGLVVALALYGEEAAVLAAEAAAPARWAAAQAAAAEREQREAEEERQRAAEQQLQLSAAEQQQEAGSAAPAASPFERAAAAAAPPAPPAAAAAPSSGGGEGEEEVPPAVADVTVAVRYLVEGGKVAFHKGYPKSGLMGFCDPSPAASKLLLVLYTFKGRPYRAVVHDREGAHLPARGAPPADEAQADFVAALAAAAGAEAAGRGGGGLSGAPSAASLASSASVSWVDNPSFASDRRRTATLD